jgi:hypothetical protein
MITRAVLWLFLSCPSGVHWSCYLAEKQEILAGWFLRWRLNPTVTIVIKAFIEIVCLIHTLFSWRARNNFTWFTFSKTFSTSAVHHTCVAARHTISW